MDQAESLRQMMSQQAGGDVRVIAVTSGKGGVGKTNVTANLAILAAQAGRRVLIVDGDLGLANVEIIFGLTPRYHLGHLLDGTAELEQVLATGPEGVRVLPGGSGVRELSVLDDAQKLRFMTALDSIEDEFDLVLIDTGAGIGDNVVFFVVGAQEALLVLTPEPTSLSDAYAAVKVLSLEGGVEHFDVLVNQVATEQQAREIYEKLCTVSRRFLKARLKLVGHLPRDENIHRAVLSQRPVVQAFPNSPAARAMKVVADKLLSEPPPQSSVGGLKFLWQRLLRSSGDAGVLTHP
ncbi:MAG: MinD/ParA family protein [Myxococcota bacterium]|jgi:flagellar biosynthesis protein FlhG